MKYWKGVNGECGTMEDDGHVPDSEIITKEEYDNYVASIPIPEPQNDFIEYENVDTFEILKLRKL